ncbi:hypothetical protein DICPUDRAFT_147523 [Dictyostelium purpureum]|uniref:Protein kinase domain-containing protein n=1 Tax=Dictyostelium purpureum TaxID=5786 RepID=F0Z8Q0_DICPU|nr:uncharacterized protein DICPUDRAFT_147523 [Dictyostelium purpureum]EGC39697.1 hypothetical protein DICPUDRAFT_147523 [Dictyostelium purpureum]|eukprot:XP_003283806.1 hypothetical protein DICPUDRAFT_147523 [Dictyostelium purpureum]
MDTTPDVSGLSINNNYKLEEEWSIDFNKPLNKDKTNSNFCVGVFLAKKKDNMQNNYNDEIKIPNENGQCVLKIISKEQYVKIYDFRVGDYGDHKDCLFIFMEYKSEYKTILEIINDNGGYQFSENEIKKVAHYLLFTLAFLHKKKIIHRDIKGSNILYHNSNDNQVNIKLIDFGFSKFYGDKQSNYHTFAGTPTHMAPEALYQNNKAGRGSDIWSVGCTLIEMAGGSLDRVNGKPEIPEHLSYECKNLIQHCLIADPSFRPSVIELLEHDFIKNVNDLSERDIKILKKIAICQDNTFELLNKDPISVDNTIYINKKHLIFPEFNNNNLSGLLSTLPPNITHITLPIFNHPIEPNSIPSTITSLTLNSFNQDLDEESIPNTLTELILGEDFEFNEYGGNIPESIKKFQCSYNFKAALKKNNNIPKTVHSLVLNNYNHSILKESIPKSTRSLTLGSNFKDFASLTNIPSSVFNLTFGVKDYQISDDELIFIPKTYRIVLQDSQLERKLLGTFELYSCTENPPDAQNLEGLDKETVIEFIILNGRLIDNFNKVFDIIYAYENLQLFKDSFKKQLLIQKFGQDNLELYIYLALKNSDWGAAKFYIEFMNNQEILNEELSQSLFNHENSSNDTDIRKHNVDTIKHFIQFILQKESNITPTVINILNYLYLFLIGCLDVDKKSCDEIRSVYKNHLIPIEHGLSHSLRYFLIRKPDLVFYPPQTDDDAFLLNNIDPNIFTYDYILGCHENGSFVNSINTIIDQILLQLSTPYASTYIHLKSIYINYYLETLLKFKRFYLFFKTMDKIYSENDQNNNNYDDPLDIIFTNALPFEYSDLVYLLISNCMNSFQLKRLIDYNCGTANKFYINMVINGNFTLAKFILDEYTSTITSFISSSEPSYIFFELEMLLKYHPEKLNENLIKSIPQSTEIINLFQKYNFKEQTI